MKCIIFKSFRPGFKKYRLCMFSYIFIDFFGSLCVCNLCQACENLKVVQQIRPGPECCAIMFAPFLGSSCLLCAVYLLQIVLCSQFVFLQSSLRLDFGISRIRFFPASCSSQLIANQISSSIITNVIINI